MTSLFESPAIATDEVFVFPASFAQQRLWFLHQLAPKNPFYNVAAAVRLQGSLNFPALEQTFQTIVQRHESLRTTFAITNGELVQVITPAVNLSISRLDQSTLSEPDLKQWIVTEAQRPFELTKGDLLRIQLLQLDDTDFILLIVLHHIIADGWSMGVMLQELGILYAAFCLTQPSPLRELPIQYADFAVWQHEWLQTGVLETQLNYWRQQLQNLPQLQLPTDYPRPPVQQYRGATQAIALPESLTSALEALSQRTGVSLFMTLLAAFQTLLYRYTGQTDIAVGTPIANRNRQELEELIGFFVNSLVMRVDLGGNPSVWELLERVRQVTLEAYAHQDLPFEKLVQDLHPQRDLSLHPLFQVAIALQNTPIRELALPDLQLSPFEFDSGTTRLDLELHFWRSPAGLRGQATYSTALFQPQTIARLLGHFQTLLEGMVDNPQQRLSELPLLTPAERQQLFVEWNQTHLPISPTCIHSLFEAQVAQTPDAIALISGNQQVSYRALNQRSNQLARYLQQQGIGPETLVGVCMARSPRWIITLLAILKAGGAYLPVDPEYPPERLAFMLEDAQVQFLITHPSLIDQIPLIHGKVIEIEQVESRITHQDDQNLHAPVNGSNLAYVMYTSGSTGQPKGVQIEHLGVCNLAIAQRQFQLQSGDRVLQFASSSFDASIFEIILAFQAGATLYLRSSEDTLQQFLQHHTIQVITLPPAVLNTLSPELLPALHTIISAGEACSRELVMRWSTPNRRFFNAYGPTEATVWTTIAELSANHPTPHLGHAIANTQLYVLDASRQAVPIGIPGELYIGGSGVARGYLNRPALNQERFISYPLAERGARLYKTGDRVRYRADGALEFLGRIDNQVKIRGYRIELGEIEAALIQHPIVKTAVAVVRAGDTGNPQLVACLVMHDDFNHGFTIDHLRSDLQRQLPEYLIPAAFERWESLPLTPNGKVDRTALQTAQPKELQKPNLPIALSAVEAAIAQIWTTTLKRESVHPNDHFFESGGDSLLAMQFMDQLNQQFNQSLPLSILFQSPTIAQLAAHMEQPTPPPVPNSPLVLLKPGDRKPPFFCVHPIFGVVFPYLELAHHLDLAQPFYGLQAIGLDRVEDMATQYIQAIRSVQPQGPYRLGGWSFGGLVAFEMAHQLQAAGESVALLALLDTPAPLPNQQPQWRDGLRFLFTTVSHSILPFILDYGTLILSSSWFRHLQQSAIAPLIPEASRMRLLNELAVLPMLQIFNANNHAVRQYQPKVYNGNITLFRTTTTIMNATPESTLGWQSLTTQNIQLHAVDGNHLSMLKPPYVQGLAQQLQACLNQADNPNI